MNENEYLSVQELADKVGLTYQAIYKRLNTTLEPYVKEFQGKKVLHITVLEKFNMEVPEGIIQEEPLDVAETLNLMIETLNTQLKIMNSQIEIKDSQISERDKLLSEMSERLKDTTNVVQSQQHMLQIEQRLRLPEHCNMPEDQYEEVEKSDEPVKKKLTESVEKQTGFVAWFKRKFNA